MWVIVIEGIGVSSMIFLGGLKLVFEVGFYDGVECGG